MNTENLIPLPIPVPPTPTLEKAVGYENQHGARYLSLWWEMCGDEAMVSDGFVVFTGHWPGYLAYVRHPLVQPHLHWYNLGSSDGEASHRLVIDMIAQKAYVAPVRAAAALMEAQLPESTGVFSMDELVEQLNHNAKLLFQEPTMNEIEDLMRRDYEAVLALTSWLDRCAAFQSYGG